MADISHTIGNDLQVDATGDLLTSDGLILGQERVLRRLFTSPAAYVWQQSYGAGLARFLGRPMAQARLIAITRAQMFQEASVARSPAPVIQVQISTDGTTVESISYVDTSSEQVVRLPALTITASTGSTPVIPPVNPAGAMADSTGTGLTDSSGSYLFTT